MVRFVRTTLLVLVLAFTAHGSAAAQAEAESDSLRLFIEELLTDLLFAEGRPEIRPGALASNIPTLPVTEEQVLGSLEYSTFSLSLLRASQSSDLVAQVKESLQQQGWTLKARDQAPGFSLVPAQASALLCSDSSILSISKDQRGRVMIIGASGPMFMPQCSEVQSVDSEGRPIPPLPSLDAPAGAKSFGTTNGGGGDSWEFTTQLSTELSPREILAHYTSELIEAGATFGDEGVTPRSAVAPFDIVDSHGTHWRGTLAVITTAPNRRNVYLQLLLRD